MRKMLVLAVLLVGLLLIPILVTAQCATYFSVRTIMIGQNLRVVHIYIDGEGLHEVYFTEPRAGDNSQYLGERVYKDRQLVLDTYNGK